MGSYPLIASIASFVVWLYACGDDDLDPVCTCMEAICSSRVSCTCDGKTCRRSILDAPQIDDE